MRKLLNVTALLTSLGLLTGCASVPTNTVQAAAVPEAGNATSGQIAIPQLGVEDNGAQLNLSSGAAAQQSIYNIVAPLKEAERKYIAMATFFVADYENCLETGNIRVHETVRNKDRFRNLTPEGCYKNRRQIHKMADLTRQSYGQHGRPDPNKVVRYNTLATGPVDKGWGPSESWQRYAGRTGTGANGMTRTDIQVKYHTIMGGSAEKIVSDGLIKTDEFLGNPLGAILDGITPGS